MIIPLGQELVLTKEGVEIFNETMEKRVDLFPPLFKDYNREIYTAKEGDVLVSLEGHSNCPYCVKKGVNTEFMPFWVSLSYDEGHFTIKED